MMIIITANIKIVLTLFQVLFQALMYINSFNAHNNSLEYFFILEIRKVKVGEVACPGLHSKRAGLRTPVVWLQSLKSSHSDRHSTNKHTKI